MKILDIIIAAMLIVGGLNWGLVGFLEFNLIETIFGEASAISRLVYALVGVSALYEVGSFAIGFKSVQHRWCETASTVKH